MNIAIGCDHAGFALKAAVTQEVQFKGHTAIDMGTASEEPVDYPDFAKLVAEAIISGKAQRGIILCGSGIGACIVANKFKSIRAGTCHDTYSARQAVEHDDMNVLCLGARVIGPLLAQAIVDEFLDAKFTHEERHQRRLGKINALEKAHMR